jgi:hypothetical protein
VDVPSETRGQMQMNMKEHLRILTEIRENMNKNYQKRWGGRDGPVALPAQICDLNQSETLYYGYYISML